MRPNGRDTVRALVRGPGRCGLLLSIRMAAVRRQAAHRPALRRRVQRPPGLSPRRPSFIPRLFRDGWMRSRASTSWPWAC